MLPLSPTNAQMRVKLSTRMDDPRSTSKITVENAPSELRRNKRYAHEVEEWNRKIKVNSRPASEGSNKYASNSIYLLAASQDDVRESAIRIFQAAKSRANHETIGKDSFYELCRRLWMLAAHARRINGSGELNSNSNRDTSEEHQHILNGCGQGVVDSEWLAATMGNKQPLTFRRFLLWLSDVAWRWRFENTEDCAKIKSSEKVRKLIEFVKNLSIELISPHGLSLRNETAILRSLNLNTDSFSHFDILHPVPRVSRAPSGRLTPLGSRKSAMHGRKKMPQQTQINVNKVAFTGNDKSEATKSSPNKFIQHLVDMQGEAGNQHRTMFGHNSKHDSRAKEGIVLSRPNTCGSIHNLHPGVPELTRQQAQNLSVLSRRKYSLSESISAFPVTPWIEEEVASFPAESRKDKNLAIDVNISEAIDSAFSPELTSLDTISTVDVKLADDINAEPETNFSPRADTRQPKLLQRQKVRSSNKSKHQHLPSQSRLKGAQSNRKSLGPGDGPTLHCVTLDCTGLDQKFKVARRQNQLIGVSGMQASSMPNLGLSKFRRQRKYGTGLMYINKSKSRDSNCPSFDEKKSHLVDERVRPLHHIPLSIPSLTDDPREIVHQQERQILIDHRLDHRKKMLIITGGSCTSTYQPSAHIPDSVDSTQGAILDTNASIFGFYGHKNRLRPISTQRPRTYQSKRERCLSEALRQDRNSRDVFEGKEGTLLRQIENLEEHARSILGPQGYADLRLQLPKPINGSQFVKPSVAELLNDNSEPGNPGSNQLGDAVRLLRIANVSERKMQDLHQKNSELKHRLLSLIEEGPYASNSL